MIIFGISVSMIVFWLALALIFLLIEAATAGLTTIWFAGGALIALLTALFDAPVALQVIIFFVVSICLLVFTRKIFVEKLKTGSEKTNVDALIGRFVLLPSVRSRSTDRFGPRLARHRKQILSKAEKSKFMPSKASSWLSPQRGRTSRSRVLIKNRYHVHRRTSGTKALQA